MSQPFGRIFPELSELLEAERCPLPPPAEAKFRIRGRLVEAAAGQALPEGDRATPRSAPIQRACRNGSPTLHAAAPVLSSAPPVQRRPELCWTTLALVGASFLAGVLAGAAIHAYLERDAPRESIAERAPLSRPGGEVARRGQAASPRGPRGAAVEAHAGSESSALPGAEAVGGAKPAPTTARPPGAVEPPPPAIEIERAWLGRARAALARGQVADARAALGSHLEEFPGGQLAEEREALIVHTFAAEGRHEESRERARAFRARYPRSQLLPSPATPVESSLSH